MSKRTSDQPYLTFSEDWRYAFIERGRVTQARADVVGWLDRRLHDPKHPVVPSIRRWDPGRAEVLGLESWDEIDGRRLRGPVPGSRVLWRVDVSRALELQPVDRTHGRRLVGRLVELYAEGFLDRDELTRAKLLHAAIEEAEAERLERQALRPASAPRAPVSVDAGPLLARLMLILMAALGASPEDHGDEVGQALRGMQLRIEAEEERQVMALRAELDGFGPR